MGIYFHGQQILGPRGPAGPDGNPIGTIISFMGKTAPEDYLVCDGSEHRIEDYPELADFFEEQFGEKSYFGGDGENIFNVPNISQTQGDIAGIYCIKAVYTEPALEEYDTSVDDCNWHVRKWSNGYCEFLGSKIYSGLNLNNSWGSSGLYYSTDQIGPSFPFALVKKYFETLSPDANHIGDGGKSSGGLIVTSGSYTMDGLDKSNNFSFIRQTSTVDRSIRMYFHVCGLWK